MSGPPRGPRPHCLMAEQTQGWKWGQYRHSPALSHSVNALLHTSQPAKNSICWREEKSHTHQQHSFSCFHRRFQHMVLCKSKPIVKTENGPNLSHLIYQQIGCLCSFNSRTGRCPPLAETPRPVIACKIHGEPKEQLPLNTSRTGHIKTNTLSYLILCIS